MTGETLATSAYLALALVLVCSGFVARRLPMKRTLVMFAGWIAVFGVGYLIVSFLSP